MSVEVSIFGNKIDTFPLRDLLIQSESNSDTISFINESEYYGLNWTVRGVNSNNEYIQSPTLSSYEYEGGTRIDWPVTSDFLAVSGKLKLTLVGSNNDGTIVTKALGEVIIISDPSVSSMAPVTQNLFEQLLSQAAAKVLDSEAWALGTRSGIPVDEDDPAYHNNSKYFSDSIINLEVNAETDVSIGVPFVSVETSINPETGNKRLDFSFSHLKGERGIPGLQMAIFDFSSTIPVASWEGDILTGFEADIPITGLLATDEPFVDIDLDNLQYSQALEVQTAWSSVYKVVANAGSMSFYSSLSPNITIPFKARCMR